MSPPRHRWCSRETTSRTGSGTRWTGTRTPTGSTATVDREDYGGRFEKGFLGRGSLWLYGNISRFVTDGAVTVIDGEGNVVTAVRVDKAWQAGADLGYYLRPKLRIGVAATYTKRRSTFDDFGLKGLLVGGTVTYNPN